MNEARMCVVRRVCLLVALVLSGAVPPAFAAEEPVEEPFDLGVLEFSVDRWTYDQEVVLRMIRKVFENPYSDHPRDRDAWRCWIRERPGSRVGRLYCGRMGDITARRPVEMLKTSSARAAGYGTILESTDTVTRARFRKIMEDLSGPEQFNDEFVELLQQGQRPPRYFPRDEEIDDFISAARAINALPLDTPDEELKRLIGATSLSLARYNEIARMVELFPSVESTMVARAQERLDQTPRPVAPGPE